MTLRKINHYLSVFQLVGFSAAFALLAGLWIIEGGMAIFYAFFAFVLILPFLSISYYSVLVSTEPESNIELCINTALSLIVIPSLLMPFVYEWGGVVIAAFCLALGAFVLLSKSIDKRLIVINVIGCLVLVGLVVISLQ